MVFVGIALYVVAIGSWIAALVTAAQMRRPGWVVAIALLPPVGAFAWFLFGPWGRSHRPAQDA